MPVTRSSGAADTDDFAMQMVNYIISSEVFKSFIVNALNIAISETLKPLCPYPIQILSWFAIINLFIFFLQVFSRKNTLVLQSQSKLGSQFVLFSILLWTQFTISEEEVCLMRLRPRNWKR
jgi:hypothetical protein